MSKEICSGKCDVQRHKCNESAGVAKDCNRSKYLQLSLFSVKYYNFH